jgi:hypothetical protein
VSRKLQTSRVARCPESNLLELARGLVRELFPNSFSISRTKSYAESDRCRRPLRERERNSCVRTQCVVDRLRGKREKRQAEIQTHYILQSESWSAIDTYWTLGATTLGLSKKKKRFENRFLALKNSETDAR